MATIGKISEVALGSIRPSETNPRRITEERMTALRRALREAPEMLKLRPIIVNAQGEIVAGEMRWRAAGLEEWPKIRAATVTFDSPEEETEWRLRDNNPYGEWVELELAEMLYHHEQAGRDLELTGFTKEETTKLIDLVAGPERAHNFPDEPAPKRPENPTSKPGQVYKLGAHRLMCGDATNPKHVARLLAGATPTICITDPPYGVDLDLSWHDYKTKDVKRQNTKITGDTRVDWSPVFELVPSLVTLYVWHAASYAGEVQNGLERAGYTIVQQIIWDKMAFALSRSRYQWRHEVAYYAARTGADVPWYAPIHVPAFFARKAGAMEPWLGAHDQHTIWSAPSPKRRKDEGEDEQSDHPTQKPVLLWQRPIQNHTLRGEHIYEPFAGSGTALIAAEVTGRTCYAMELDPAYCDVIRERYEAFTT